METCRNAENCAGYKVVELAEQLVDRSNTCDPHM